MTEKITNEDREFTFSEAEYKKLMDEDKAARMKSLRRHKLPEELTVEAAMSGMTKQELEDIQYNLNLPVASNLNKVKKAEMVEAVVPAVIAFAGRWFVSIIEDQKQVFDFLYEQKEAVADLQVEDARLDYLRAIGVISCGMKDGKLCWYMPEEIKAEYAKLNNGAFVDAVNLNTEAMRLAAGLVFYYGIMDYDLLHEKVNEYLDAKLEFAEFMGVIFNGGSWCRNVVVGQHELMNDMLFNPEALLRAQSEQGPLDYAQFPYDKVYEAGQDNYIESTAAYRALAQHLMKKMNLDVLQAADAVNSILCILQNGMGMKEVIGFLADHNLRPAAGTASEELYGLIGRLNHAQPLWVLKGHTPMELENMPKPATVIRGGKKIGRNDPCPCGSGKKYKNCCIDKEYN